MRVYALLLVEGLDMAMIMVVVLGWACKMTSIRNELWKMTRNFYSSIKLTSYLR